MPAKPKSQHWVPRFYLRHFSTPETRDTDNPKAWIFAKKDGDPCLMSIRKVAAQRFLYTPKGPEGNRNWWMEERLQDMESVLAGMWQDIASGFVDIESCEHLRKALALFASTLHLRHPDALRRTADVHSKLVAFLDDCPKSTAGEPLISHVEYRGSVTPFESSGFLEYRNAGPDGIRHMFVEAIRAQARNLAEKLLDKRWSVVFSDSPVFITTDTPLVLVHEDRAIFGTCTPGTRIVFPLSPTRLLVMDDRLNQPRGQYYRLSKREEACYNFTVWRGCSRFMISPRNTDEACAEMLRWGDSPKE